MKTYTTKSNARRAAVSKIATIKNVDKEEALAIAKTLECRGTKEVGFYYTPERDLAPKPVEKTASRRDPQKASTIEKPCNQVWEIAIEMNKQGPARRKDVIDACVEAGINFYTARTQYQLWYSATKSSEK